MKSIDDLTVIANAPPPKKAGFLASVIKKAIGRKKNDTPENSNPGVFAASLRLASIGVVAIASIHLFESMRCYEWFNVAEHNTGLSIPFAMFLLMTRFAHGWQFWKVRLIEIVFASASVFTSAGWLSLFAAGGIYGYEYASAMVNTFGAAPSLAGIVITQLILLLPFLGNFLKLSDDIGDLISGIIGKFTTVKQPVIQRTSKPAPIPKPDVSISTTGRWVSILIGGDTADGRSVCWNPTDTAETPNPNMGIAGIMGTGKTQLVKSLFYQLRNAGSKNDGDMGVLVFDYKRDYQDKTFLGAVNGKSHKLHKLPFNPLSLFGTAPLLPVRTASAVTDTIAKSFGLGQVQRATLKEAIIKAYNHAGIHERKPETWSKPAPTFRDVWEVYTEVSEDDAAPKMDSLYAALDMINSLELFEDDTSKLESLYGLIESDGLTVIDLAGNDDSVQDLVVALTLDLFYSQMQITGKPKPKGDFRRISKMILVDEADNFMSKGYPVLKKILKEGREFGVGAVLSTQLLTHFSTKAANYASYMKSWVLHGVDELSNDDVKRVFNVSDKHEQAELINELGSMGKFEAYYIPANKERVRIDTKPFYTWMK